MSNLLIIGYSYSAAALAPQLLAQGWQVSGTTRSPEKLDSIKAQGVTPLLWSDDLSPALHAATHLLISAAPGKDGDPFLAKTGSNIAKQVPNLTWAGYLSTTGVYGDCQGAWIDETAALSPTTERGKMRVQAEAAWRATGLPLHIFRLAGIYGPGRGPFAKVKSGKARRIIKPDQVFSRIHVEDIAQVLAASIAKPNLGAAYNLCDDEPAPPQDVIAYAAELLGLPLPPEEPFETADMTPMARSFYAENKRVSNFRIKNELGVSLLYPDYKTGLKALL
ncbi:SDR family oxidoreductase [Lentibacter algarum]|uniref:SDR family oxidoreductase n=1 Tax=Lentibacter algarum TaxID=576131 RepID=UPI001C064E4E|nr:SDR family oxidoreductase [Lentibacter algarum]MBU2981106.1 SDR family oxidoreductase [Lentibacter algarum]